MSGNKNSGRKKATGEETKPVYTRLTNERIKQLKQAARGDSRTPSNYLSVLITSHLDAINKKSGD